MKNSLLLLIVIFSSITLTFASKVTGKWESSIETDNGPMEFTVTYEVEGEKISGFFTSEYGILEFDNGKISGSEFEYTFLIDGSEVKHNGKLEGEEIKVKWTSEYYGDGEFVLKKVVE